VVFGALNDGSQESAGESYADLLIVAEWVRRESHGGCVELFVTGGQTGHVGITPDWAVTMERPAVARMAMEVVIFILASFVMVE
jgi:LDH2 family malate/lactate/ureidoglycolate dehydrogenase